MKDIELPRKVLVGHRAIYEIDDLVKNLGLSGSGLVLCDEITKKIAANDVAIQLSTKAVVTETSSKKELEHLGEQTSKKDVGYIIGVGGGRILDTGKLLAFRAKKPFISIPTAASHDGIASPQVSIKQEKPISVRVHSPLGVICDTEIIGKAPKRLIASGCADAISNYTAVLDWKHAHKEKGDYFGDYAAALAQMSSEIILENPHKIKDDVTILVEALISSGVAIGIAGSSRPCSGGEHLFSHTLDLICKKPALHGEQCGVGTILMAYLHKADWELVKKSLKICGAPTTAKELGIPVEKMIEALTKAHSMRDRYTILGNGVSEEKATEVLENTGVI